MKFPAGWNLHITARYSKSLNFREYHLTNFLIADHEYIIINHLLAKCLNFIHATRDFVSTLTITLITISQQYFGI